MTEVDRQQERFVLPGERLAVIEEFMEGQGSYVRNGVVRSAELGRVRFDLGERIVRVLKSTRELIIPKEGPVIGQVGAVQRRTANVDIFIVDGREVSRPYTGVIYASSAGGYERNLGLAVRDGDIVRARITNTKNRIVQLSIDSPEYGVIYAYCSRCGTLLEYDKPRLTCRRCGRVERRKLAKDHGQEGLP